MNVDDWKIDHPIFHQQDLYTSLRREVYRERAITQLERSSATGQTVEGFSANGIDVALRLRLVGMNLSFDDIARLEKHFLPAVVRMQRRAIVYVTVGKKHGRRAFQVQRADTQKPFRMRWLYDTNKGWNDRLTFS